MDLIQVDDSSSSLEPEKQAPCTHPRYRGTEVPESLTSADRPAGASCGWTVLLSAAGLVLPDPPIR